MFSDSYDTTRPAYLHPVTHFLKHDTLTYICMCVCKYTHITAYVMPRADISRCQARKSRPGIAFQTLKLSSIKEVISREFVLRLSKINLGLGSLLSSCVLCFQLVSTKFDRFYC